jgi:hypothetical protein
VRNSVTADEADRFNSGRNWQGVMPTLGLSEKLDGMYPSIRAGVAWRSGSQSVHPSIGGVTSRIAVRTLGELPLSFCAKRFCRT